MILIIGIFYNYVHLYTCIDRAIFSFCIYLFVHFCVYILAKRYMQKLKISQIRQISRK